jgi:hypothetical protein
MPTHSKQSIKKIVLRSLGTVMIGSVVVFSFLILINVCSQLITNVFHYYNATKQLTLP